VIHTFTLPAPPKATWAHCEEVIAWLAVVLVFFTFTSRLLFWLVVRTCPWATKLAVRSKSGKRSFLRFTGYPFIDIEDANVCAGPAPRFGELRGIEILGKDHYGDGLEISVTKTLTWPALAGCSGFIVGKLAEPV